MAGLVGLGRPEYLAWLGNQPESDYLVLMGANTYRTGARVCCVSGRLS
jgi:hypothetical protein